MSTQNLLLDSPVLLWVTNVAAASLTVGLIALVLRRCVAGGSLVMDHGVLAAAVVVLLLTPVCLTVSAGIPGIGIQLPAEAVGPESVPAIDSPESTGEGVGAMLAELSMAAPLDGRIPENEDTSTFEMPDTGVIVNRSPDNDPDPAPLHEFPDVQRGVILLDSIPELSPEKAASATAAVGADVDREGELAGRTSAPVTTSERWNSGRAGSILLLVWSAGIVIGLWRCLHGFLMVTRLRRQAETVYSPEIASLIEDVSTVVGLQRVPPVLKTDRVNVPLTIGLLRPAMVLPADLIEATSETTLRAILLHEAAHIVRRDLWVGVLQRLASVLYWWNPLVHCINRHLNDVRESLCDNHVLLAGGDERDYADTLLTLAARIARPPRTASALGLVGRPSPGLSGRITRLLKKDRDMSISLAAGSRRLVVVASLATICGLSLAAVRPPGESEGSIATHAAAEHTTLESDATTVSETEAGPDVERLKSGLRPHGAIAASEVVPMLFHDHVPSQQRFTESVEWKPCVAVRAVFDRLENRPLLDFELRRQLRGGGGWQPVDIQEALDLLRQSPGFMPDVVTAVDPVITMPLPQRAISEWSADLVSHPMLRAVAGDDGDSEKILFRYLDFDVTSGDTLRYEIRIQLGVDGETVWTDWSEPTEPVTVDSVETAVRSHRDLISRSIVRMEFDINGERRTGSGVVLSIGEVSREQGFQSILTAGHLLRDFDPQKHTLHLQFYDELQRRKWSPAYIDVDEESDLAFICFEDPELKVKAAALGSLQRLPVVDDEVTFHTWSDGETARFRRQRVVAVNRYLGPSNVECDGLPQDGESAGGLFNARGELVGILMAANPQEQRGVFRTLPAIFRFLGIDGSEIADSPEGEDYGHPVTGTPIGLPGPPHIPQGSSAQLPPMVTGPGPGSVVGTGPGPGVVAEAATDVILIALSADDDGALTEIHFLTDSLGTGDDAVERLSQRLADAADGESTLQVQISVDPRLKYESVARIMEACEDGGANEVRLATLGPDEEFVINIGFVRDNEGRKLSETPVVFWDNRARSADDLSGVFEWQRQQQPDTDTIVLRADSDVSAGVVQEVIRQAQAAGFEKFSLRVLEAETGESTLDGMSTFERIRQHQLRNRRLQSNGLVMDVLTQQQVTVIQVSIGSDDGLLIGHGLDVYRGGSPDDREHVGRAEIIHLQPDQAVARVIQMWTGNPIESGDIVIGPVSPDARYPGPARVVNDEDKYIGPTVQLHVDQPEPMHLRWLDPESGESQVLVAPCRVNVTPGVLPLKLSSVPGRIGLELQASIQIPTPVSAASTYLAHNAVPIELTEEDLDQAESGNHVVKVIYLPDPEFQELAIAGVESLVTTRLDPGTDPLAEADRRGTILAVVRLGNRTSDD